MLSKFLYINICILICSIFPSCKKNIEEKDNQLITSDVFIVELIKNVDEQNKDPFGYITYFTKSKNKHLIPKHLSVEELILGEIDHPPWGTKINYFAIEKEGVTRLVMSLTQYVPSSTSTRISINQFKNHPDGSITIVDEFTIEENKWNEYLKSLLPDNSK